MKIKIRSRYMVFSIFMLLLFCMSIFSAPPVEPYEDLRGAVLRRAGKDLSKLDLRNIDLTKTTFDSFTPWPPADRLPSGFKPKELMEWGTYPGLGIRNLHEQGITGRGVHVAIIDQPLLRNHIEYRDQLTSYSEIQTDNAGAQMHGPAVASILVGRTCGVAPEAILHYWAEPSWKQDYRYRCEALEQIIAYNNGKPRSLQIRIVSVSKGFSPLEPNLDRWKSLLEKAKQNGIYVIHCSKNMFGVGCPAYKDQDVFENYQLCAFYTRPVFGQSGMLFAPIDNRTMASEQGEEAYTFWSKGGLSWGAPYIAGVAALGLQANPALTVEKIEHLLYDSGWDFQKGKLINPAGFVHEARKLLTQ